ncbi:MAG: ribosomal protein S18-alanine N-acetyltransferase [Burkholderiales bacterium]
MSQAAIELYRRTQAGAEPELSLRPMRLDDVEAVLAVEQAIYPYPWSAGNFRDAVRFGNSCWVAELAGELAGYAVLLAAAGEAQLLNIGVASRFQHRGWGRRLLDFTLAEARRLEAGEMFLEVRPSNLAALALYRRAGFVQVGRRRNYYPAAAGREDALVLRLAL